MHFCKKSGGAATEETRLNTIGLSAQTQVKACRLELRVRHFWARAYSTSLHESFDLLPRQNTIAALLVVYFGEQRPLHHTRSQPHDSYELRCFVAAAIAFLCLSVSSAL